MIRKIIKIDESKCNGCGVCADACHEGAIEIINGKAALTREDYCDGLGDCLPECPTGAISFEEREAPAYNEAAVLAAKQEKAKKSPSNKGSAFSLAAVYREGGKLCSRDGKKLLYRHCTNSAGISQLGQWPCQIKLAPVNAPYFNGAELLIAADCTAYAYANIHADFMAGKVTLIGCPKLDAVDYSEKLGAIIKNNGIKSVTVLRMEVPCCGGLEMAVKKALQESGKNISMQTMTISIDGNIL